MFYTVKNTFSCSEGFLGFLLGGGVVSGGLGLDFFVGFWVFSNFGLFKTFSGWDYMGGGSRRVALLLVGSHNCMPFNFCTVQEIMV